MPSAVDDVKKTLEELFKNKKDAKKGKSLGSLQLVYDSPEAHLESIYFWVLDFLNGISSGDVEKLVDNFASAPGSGHFQEMGLRATKMQEEGMKILGAVNQVVKSVLNLIYDLKEFEIRIKTYDKAKSKDAKDKEEGMLALKQIWMDNVDIKKGRGSINQMTFELGFSTLRDAFMVSNTVEDLKKNEIINDQIKRILIPRLSEFLLWVDASDAEIRKRFEIEKSYLRSQVETIKLYTAWAKPYLKAANDLTQKGFEKNAALVSAFNTTLFDRVLLAKFPTNLEKAIYNKKLPRSFENYKLKRNYYSCVLVSVTFTGFPQKVSQQHYGFGGKVTMNFDCYAFNEEELALFKETMGKNDMEASIKFLTDSSQSSLDQLKTDLDHFLLDDKKKEGKKSDIGDIFSAIKDLFKFLPEKKEQKKIEKIGDIKKDNYVESEIRSLSIIDAKEAMYNTYDIYKKAHLMASSPESFDVFKD